MPLFNILKSAASICPFSNLKAVIPNRHHIERPKILNPPQHMI